MASAVDGGDVKGVGEAVERDGAGERDDMSAVDQPAFEAALRRRKLIKVDARGVLTEPGRGLVFGLFDGDASTWSIFSPIA